MADSDKTLEILIKLGVIGREDAAAVKDLLGEMNQQAEVMNGSVPENLRNLEKQGKGLKEVGEGAKHSGTEHRALHMALDKLNEVIPGLGSSLAMLSHGFMEESEAAKAGSVANEGFILSMGPIAILLLAIEAVVAAYKRVTEGAAEAAKAQEESWKAADENARKAREAMEGYLTALQNARSADDDWRGGLTQDNAVLDAQLEAHKKVLKALEANELAAATSEDAKKAIKQKYADLDQDLDKSKAQGRIKNEQDAIARIQDEEGKAFAKKEELEEKRNIAAHEFGAVDPRARAWDKQIEDLGTKIAKFEQDKTTLQTEIGNQSQIAGINNQGDVNASIVKGDAGGAAKGIADIVSGGGTVPTNQRAFMLEFADQIAHQMGGLHPDQNFNSAKAAAAFIENFFKTQTDPYDQLFQRIHSAVLASKRGQDALASMWIARFQALEAQLHATASMGHL